MREGEERERGSLIIHCFMMVEGYGKASGVDTFIFSRVFILTDMV